MFKKLLIPLDRSSLAEQAVGAATTIALASHAEVDIALAHERLPIGSFLDAPWSAEQLKDEQQYVAEIAGEIASGSGLAVTHSVLQGEPSAMIDRRAHDVGADLIVMTSHGRTGLSRAWLGSIADAVVRRSSIPVLMLRPVEGKTRRDVAQFRFKHVLVPVDGSGLSEEVLSAAVSLAKSTSARLTLLRVVQPVPMILMEAGPPFAYPPQIPDEAATALVVEEATEQMHILATNVKAHVEGAEANVIVADHVAQGILDFARAHECDLIAMSTRGRGASRLVVGNIADKILRGSDLPILLHRPTAVVGGDAANAAADAASFASA